MDKQRLDSWKSIADYLQRSTRTVQRWHVRHGLPVHHFRGPRGGAFAYANEIDSWVSGLTSKAGKQDVERSHGTDTHKRSFELTAIANQLWEIRSEKNIHSISGLYSEAIDEDSGNAAAYAGLANAMIFLGLHGMVEGSIAYPRAMEALHRMGRIEADYPGRKCTAAWLDLCWKRKWGRAKAGFDAVLGEGNCASLALPGRALLHIAEGNLSEAWECAWEAWNLNALAPPLSALLCWIAYLAHDNDKALRQATAARLNGGCGATLAAIEALALIQDGSIAHHLGRLERFNFDYPHDRTLEGALGYWYAISNQTKRALKTLESLGRTNEGWNNANCAYGAALVLIGLGKRQEAIETLEASYAAGSQWSLGFRFDPILISLHGEPIFEDFLQRVCPTPETKGGKSGHSLEPAPASNSTSSQLESRSVVAHGWPGVHRIDGD
jgi:tetratricopeptide (TPR) repeat protein